MEPELIQWLCLHYRGAILHVNAHLCLNGCHNPWAPERWRLADALAGGHIVLDSPFA